jgi:hypothetical protein
MGKKRDITYEFIESTTVPPGAWYVNHAHKIPSMFPEELYRIFLKWCEDNEYQKEQPFSDANDFNKYFLEHLKDFDMEYEMVLCRSKYNRSRSTHKINFRRFRFNLYGSYIMNISYPQRRRKAKMKAIDKISSKRR